ncbi:MAG: hypothetical protein Q8K63_09730 [Acidimicrobiales bacterium]|nr:hypothetical protein [Acidimicrobiales bacterium]
MGEVDTEKTGSERGGPHDRGRIVRRYLSALDAKKPGRTNARTAETVAHRMHQIDTLLLSADPVQRLHLTQERIDLHAEMLRLHGPASNDFESLEKAFIRVAKSYGDRHDVTYSAWRQVGVDAGVLAAAGIHQQVKPGRASKAPEAAAKAPETAPKAEPAPDAAPAAEVTPTNPPPKKAATAKRAPAAKKQAASTDGSAPKQVKKAASKKTADPKPEQQQLPAEAHLLS